MSSDVISNDVFEEAAAGAYLVLAAPDAHSERAAAAAAADPINAKLSGADIPKFGVTSGSASSSSACGRPTARASEILAFRLLDEETTFSEIYHYEDSDERQHPLFVHPPPLTAQSVGSGRADTVEAAAHNHPSVYISTVGEEPVADAPVSSSLTQRCGGADQGAAAVSASDYATDAATIADAENRADAHSKAHDLSLVPGFRPTPRLLAPQASDEAEAGDERVPEVSWTAPSSPTIVALLAALYAFIPSGAKLPSSFSCVPQSQLPVPHPCAERVASDDTAALSTSSSPTPPPPLRSVALQLLRHVVHDRRLQQRLLRHYVDHKTTVAALNAASVALGGHSAPLSEDAPIDSLIDNVSALPAQAPSSAASQAALASSREFQSSPTLDLSGDSASSPSLVGGVSAATPSVDDKLEARRARIRVVMEQTITPGHRAFASQDDGAVKDVSAIASHSQSDVPAALASPTDSKPSLGIINSFASPFSALSASSLASSVASFFRVPSFFSSSSPSQESVSISASSAIESDAALAAAFAVSLVAPLTAPIAPVPASLTPVQFGLRALYARYLTRCQHALKAKQSHVHLIAVMKGWCLNRLQLDILQWQGGGYLSLIDMAHALYETELRRLALLKEASSLHICLLIYQMHVIHRLLKRSEHEIVFAWEAGAICAPDGTLLEFPFLPDGSATDCANDSAAELVSDMERLEREHGELHDLLPPGLRPVSVAPPGSAQLDPPALDIEPHSVSMDCASSSPQSPPLPPQADAAVAAALSSLFSNMSVSHVAGPLASAPSTDDVPLFSVPVASADASAVAKPVLSGHTTLLSASPFAASLAAASHLLSPPPLRAKTVQIPALAKLPVAPSLASVDESAESAQSLSAASTATIAGMETRMATVSTTTILTTVSTAFSVLPASSSSSGSASAVSTEVTSTTVTESSTHTSLAFEHGLGAQTTPFFTVSSSSQSSPCTLTSLHADTLRNQLAMLCGDAELVQSESDSYVESLTFFTRAWDAYTADPASLHTSCAETRADATSVALASLTPVKHPVLVTALSAIREMQALHAQSHDMSQMVRVLTQQYSVLRIKAARVLSRDERRALLLELLSRAMRRRRATRHMFRSLDPVAEELERLALSTQAPPPLMQLAHADSCVDTVSGDAHDACISALVAAIVSAAVAHAVSAAIAADTLDAILESVSQRAAEELGTAETNIGVTHQATHESDSDESDTNDGAAGEYRVCDDADLAKMLVPSASDNAFGTLDDSAAGREAFATPRTSDSASGDDLLAQMAAAAAAAIMADEQLYSEDAVADPVADAEEQGGPIIGVASSLDDAATNSMPESPPLSDAAAQDPAPLHAASQPEPVGAPAAPASTVADADAGATSGGFFSYLWSSSATPVPSPAPAPAPAPVAISSAQAALPSTTQLPVAEASAPSAPDSTFTATASSFFSSFFFAAPASPAAPESACQSSSSPPPPLHPTQPSTPRVQSPLPPPIQILDEDALLDEKLVRLLVEPAPVGTAAAAAQDFATESTAEHFRSRARLLASSLSPSSSAGRDADAAQPTRSSMGLEHSRQDARAEQDAQDDLDDDDDDPFHAYASVLRCTPSDDDDFVLDDFYFHPLAPIEQFNFDLFLCDQRYAEGQTFVNWLQVLRVECEPWMAAQTRWRLAIEAEWRMRQATRLQLAHARAARAERRKFRSAEAAAAKLAAAKVRADNGEPLPNANGGDSQAAASVSASSRESNQSIGSCHVDDGPLGHAHPVASAPASASACDSNTAVDGAPGVAAASEVATECTLESDSADAMHDAEMAALALRSSNELTLDEMFALATYQRANEEAAAARADANARALAASAAAATTYSSSFSSSASPPSDDLSSTSAQSEDEALQASIEAALEADEEREEQLEAAELERWGANAVWLVDAAAEAAALAAEARACKTADTAHASQPSSFLQKAMALPAQAANLIISSASAAYHIGGLAPAAGSHHGHAHSDHDGHGEGSTYTNIADANCGIHFDPAVHTFGPVYLMFASPPVEVVRRRAIMSRRHILRFLADFSEFLVRKIEAPLLHVPSLRLDLERALFPRLERLGVLRLHAAPIEVRDDAAFRQQCAWLARLGPTEIGLHAAICKVFAHLSVWNAHSADCAAPSTDAIASAAASSPIAWSSSGTVQPWFPFSKAIQTLHSLNYLRVPADMMNCLLRTIQAIAEQARAYYSAAEATSSAAQSSAVSTLAATDPAPAPVAAATHARHLVLDADTLFPLVLWVVIHARLEQSGPHYLLAHADRFAVPHSHSHPSSSSAAASEDASHASGSGNDGASTERRRHRSSNADTTQRPSESADSSSSSSSSSYASYGPASYARTLIEAAVRLVVTIDPSQLFLSEASARFHAATEAALLAAAAAQSAAAKSTNANGAPNSTSNAPFDPTGGNPGGRSASALMAANGASKSAAASKKTRDEVDEAAKEVSLMSLMM